MAHMAASLAHELNQPLSAINAYLNILRRLLRNERELEKVDEALDSAARQVTRAAEIISNLRDFIAHGETDKTLQNLNQVVRTACEFTDAMAPPRPIASVNEGADFEPVSSSFEPVSRARAIVLHGKRKFAPRDRPRNRDYVRRNSGLPIHR